MANQGSVIFPQILIVYSFSPQALKMFMKPGSFACAIENRQPLLWNDRR